jgi:hypothetical protein
VNYPAQQSMVEVQEIRSTETGNLPTYDQQSEQSNASLSRGTGSAGLQADGIPRAQGATRG